MNTEYKHLSLLKYCLYLTQPWPFKLHLFYYIWLSITTITIFQQIQATMFFLLKSLSPETRLQLIKSEVFHSRMYCKWSGKLKFVSDTKNRSKCNISVIISSTSKDTRTDSSYINYLKIKHSLDVRMKSSLLINYGTGYSFLSSYCMRLASHVWLAVIKSV